MITARASYSLHSQLRNENRLTCTYVLISKHKFVLLRLQYLDFILAYPEFNFNQYLASSPFLLTNIRTLTTQHSQQLLKIKAYSSMDYRLVKHGLTCYTLTKQNYKDACQISGSYRGADEQPRLLGCYTDTALTTQTSWIFNRYLADEPRQQVFHVLWSSHKHFVSPPPPFSK